MIWSHAVKEFSWSQDAADDEDEAVAPEDVDDLTWTTATKRAGRIDSWSQHAERLESVFQRLSGLQNLSTPGALDSVKFLPSIRELQQSSVGVGSPPRPKPSNTWSTWYMRRRATSYLRKRL